MVNEARPRIFTSTTESATDTNKLGAELLMGLVSLRSKTAALSYLKIIVLSSNQLERRCGTLVNRYGPTRPPRVASACPGHNLDQRLLQNKRFVQSAQHQALIALQQQFHRPDEFRRGITPCLRQGLEQDIRIHREWIEPLVFRQQSGRHPSQLLLKPVVIHVRLDPSLPQHLIQKK